MCEYCCYWKYSLGNASEYCCFYESHKRNDISPCDEYEDTEEKVSFKEWMMLHHKDLMKK